MGVDNVGCVDSSGLGEKMKSRLFVFVLLSCIFCPPVTIASRISLLMVLLRYAKASIAYIAYIIFTRQTFLFKTITAYIAYILLDVTRPT